MPTREITTRDELTVLKLLARNGNSLGFVGMSSSLPTDAVVAIANRFGWPDREQIRRAIPAVQAAIDAEEREKSMPPSQFQVFHRPTPAPQPAAPSPRPIAAASIPVAKEKPVPAPSVTDEQSNPVQTEWERVVELGSQSHRAATRALAKRLLTTHQQLREALKEEAEFRVQQEREDRERRKVEEEIVALEAQLAAARAKLKPAKKLTPARAAGKGTHQISEATLRAAQERRDYQRTFLERHQTTVAGVKSWARLNSFTVGGGPNIARTVLDAYDTAHQALTQSHA